MTIFPDLSPRWDPSHPSGQAASLARGQSEQCSPECTQDVSLAVGTSCSGLCRQCSRLRIGALAKRLGVGNCRRGFWDMGLGTLGMKSCSGRRWGYFLLQYTQENTPCQTTAGHPSPFLWPSWLRLHHSWVQATDRSG